MQEHTTQAIAFKSPLKKLVNFFSSKMELLQYANQQGNEYLFTLCRSIATSENITF